MSALGKARAAAENARALIDALEDVADFGEDAFADLKQSVNTVFNTLAPFAPDDTRVSPLPGQELMKADLDRDYTESDYEGEREVSDIRDANIINSLVANSWPDPENRWPEQGKHKVVIDVDLPVKVIESSTPGHHHLFIDKEMTWERYVDLLTVLEEVGIIQPGYLRATESRGYSSVRLPWVRKSDVSPTTEVPLDEGFGFPAWEMNQ